MWKLLKKSKAYDDLGVVAYELTAPIIEKLHGFIDGVKNNPVMPDSLFTLFMNTFDLNSAYLVDIISILWHSIYILPTYRSTNVKWS